MWSEPAPDCKVPAGSSTVEGSQYRSFGIIAILLSPSMPGKKFIAGRNFQHDSAGVLVCHRVCRSASLFRKRLPPPLSLFIIVPWRHTAPFPQTRPVTLNAGPARLFPSLPITP
jgi:hypothetical protein